MPTNVEIKAKVDDIESLTKKATELSDTKGELLIQEDTFFLVPNGRLKLRELKDQPAQLIFYQRLDMAGPKISEFHVTPCHNPEELKITLSQALGVKGVVKKRRTLYMVGQTRVHVDDVSGLGHFMELEVMMRPDQNPDEGQGIAEDLMAKLGVRKDNLIEGAYMDLILDAGASGN